MNNRDKINILKQYSDLIKEVETMSASWEALRSKLMSPKTKVIKSDTIQETNTDRQGDNLAELVDLEVLIQLRLDDVLLTRLRIEKAIKQVDTSELRILLINRYLNGWCWEKVAVEMNYSWGWMHKLHSKALNKINEM